MKRFSFACALIVLLFSACSDDVSEEKGDRLTLRLSLNPAGKMVEQRSLGDPGTTEVFDLPRFLYFYVVNSSEDDASKQYVNSMMLEQVEWIYDEAKGIYRLKNLVPSMLLTAKNIDLDQSHVYVIASVSRLNIPVPTTSEQVENLCIKPDEQGDDFLLKDVYTNSFYDRQNGCLVQKTDVLTSDITCYHLAARVDVQWDVYPQKQNSYWVESLTLKNLPNEGYFFKPGDNVSVTGNNEIFSTNIGNQWYGRHVFYVLDSESLFCDYTLHSSGNANAPLVKEVTYPTNSLKAPYASWYRIMQRLGYPTP